jgi:hypothetical protein
VAAAVATSAVGPTACELALRPPTASRAVVRDGGDKLVF